jgi:Ala-tRNA(Pro) deacylase
MSCTEITTISDPELAAHISSAYISYQLFSHKPLFTCEDGIGIDLPGVATKNLFLTDGEKYFLVTVSDSKRVHVNELRKVVGAKKLSFASPEKMFEYLGVTPGTVTPFTSIRESSAVVEFVIDEQVAEATLMQSHPLRNDQTMILKPGDLISLIRESGRSLRILKVPERTEPGIQSQVCSIGERFPFSEKPS